MYANSSPSVMPFSPWISENRLLSLKHINACYEITFSINAEICFLIFANQTTWNEVLFTNVVGNLGYRSENFIVGLTNTHPVFHAPVLWNYTLCGQYPGAVPDGATVTVHCTNAYDRRLRFRYVIVQFPLINEPMNFCEIEVFAVGKPIQYPLYYKLGWYEA